MKRRTTSIRLAGAIFGLAALGVAQSPRLTAYGEGSCGSQFVPTWNTARELPVIGNPAFQLVSENLIGGAPGLVFLSGAPANLPFLGMTVYVNPALLFAQGCQAIGTRGVPGAGTASVPLPIPPSVALVGGRLYAQGFFLDATLAAGWVHTHGLEITIAQSVSAPGAVIRDRLRYQALMARANQREADLLGRAIWGVTQVPGYTYLRTEKFTCDGESHWMVIVQHAQTGLVTVHTLVRVNRPILHRQCRAPLAEPTQGNSLMREAIP